MIIKFLIYMVSISLIFTILKMALSNKENSNSSLLEKAVISSVEKSENLINKNAHVENSPEHQSERASSLIKTYLLERKDSSKRANLKKPKRNIFSIAYEVNENMELPSAEKEEKQENEETAAEVVSQPIHLKLIGIISMPNTHSSKEGNIKYAILSGGEEVNMVKKGDVLNSRYKILDISSESVEIKDIEFDRIEILRLERE